MNQTTELIDRETGEILSADLNPPPALLPANVPQQPQQAIATTTTRAAVGPGDLLRVALESNADLDRLERLYDLQMKWEANEARKAYVAAMAGFKKNAPTILKDKQVGFQGRNADGPTEYAHATLGGVCEQVVSALAEHGFSHNWDIQQLNDGRVHVSCVVTHSLGHSERATLNAAPDASGKKNAIQAVGSTITYLQRYSLLAVCGLAPKDLPDDDGAGSSEPMPITGGPRREQAAQAGSAAPDDLKQLAQTAASGGKPAYLDFFGKLKQSERDALGKDGTHRKIMDGFRHAPATEGASA